MQTRGGYPVRLRTWLTQPAFPTHHQLLEIQDGVIPLLKIIIGLYLILPNSQIKGLFGTHG